MYYSALKSQKNDNFVTIQEIPPDFSNTKPRQQSNPPRRFGSFLRGWLWKFFPWIGEPPPNHLDDLHKQPSFPWLGLLCLLTALSTLGFSFLVFQLFDGDPQKDSKYLKPASWLSAIISVNSIVLHIALAEGVTTAWWYRASRTDVTLQELHEIYTMGTSTMSVLLSGRRFNYVAMGTIFVATVPLNGFLLQNAITLDSSMYSNRTDLKLPLVQQLPLGFSARIKNGTLGPLSDALTSATSSMDGLTDLPVGAFYLPWTSTFESIGCWNKNNTGVCTTNITLTGFKMACTSNWDETYDLRPSSFQNNSAYKKQTVFSSQVLWNTSAPNSIQLDVVSKPNQTCQGQFLRTTCQLRAANVSFPIQVNSDSGFHPGLSLEDREWPRPVIALNSYAKTTNLSAQAELPTYANESQKNSTFGGIAQWLGQRFNGSIDWIYEDGMWSTNTSGLFTKSYRFTPYLIPKNWTDDIEPFNPQHNNQSWCRNVYNGQDWLTESGYYGQSLLLDSSMMTPTDTAFVTLHRLMLGASVSQAQTQIEDAYEQMISNASTYYDYTSEDYLKNQLVALRNATQTQDCLRYRIRYPYWGASVAITVSIVLMVAPLFYGFWTLDRRGTLSPFETAAAFGAPALQDADMKKGTEILLKEIGQRPAHFTSSTTSLPLPQQVADPRAR